MKRKLLYALVACIMLLLHGMSALAYEAADIKEEAFFDGQTLSKYAGMGAELSLYSKNAYVMNLDTGCVIYEKNGSDAAYPASAVKLMTAIVAYEAIDDLGANVVVSDNVVKQASGSNMSLKENEVLSARDLLYGLLVTGANDAALALAEYTYDSVEDFCEAMNEKAKQIGANNTHFDNVTGFHSDATITTARDMALIAKYFYYIDELFEMSNTTRHTVEKTNKTDVSRTLLNRNLLISRVRSQDYYYQGAGGMSLGSTPEGGVCAVSTVTDKQTNLTYLCVVLGAPEDESEEDKNFACIDMAALFDYCLANFSLSTVASTTEVVCEMPVKLAANTDHVTLFPKEDIKTLLPKDMVYDTDITVERRIYKESVKAPVYKGDELGEIVVMYKNNAVVGRTKLCAGTSIDRSNVLYFFNRIEMFVSGTWFKVFAITAVVLFGVYFGLSVYVSNRRRYSGRRR